MSKPWDGPDWSSVLAQHRAEYAKTEQAPIEKAMRLYRGDPWSPEDRQNKAGGGALRLVTFNLAFAIIESAVSASVPPNLQFSVFTTEEPETPSNPLEKLLCRADRIENWGYEATLSMLDALLTGRSVLKTVPAERSPGTIRAVDTRQMFFDLSARRPQDIGYFIEITPMTKRDFLAKLRRHGNRPPLYRLPDSTEVGKLATVYPAWLSESAANTAGHDWIPVFEVVDTKNRIVSHWVEGIPTPLASWEGKDYYNPYTIYNLHLNGLDCRGMSEVLLVEEIIVAINRLLTYWAELVRKQVPITGYDTSITTEDEVKKLAQGVPGSYVGMNLNGAGFDRAIGNLTPPPIPPAIENLINKLESIVSFVTGMSDSARGQVTGARTATDLAVAESANKTRLGHRVSRYMRAWEDAALNVLLLARTLDRRIPQVEDVTMIAYSPIEKNREVLRDRFKEAWATMVADPVSFNKEAIEKLFVEVYNLPVSVLNTPEQKAALAAGATDADPGIKGDVEATGQPEEAQVVADPIPGSVQATLPDEQSARATQ